MLELTSISTRETVFYCLVLLGLNKMQYLVNFSRSLASGSMTAGLLVFLTACNTLPPVSNSGQPQETAVYVRRPQVSSAGALSASDENSLLARRTIYFDFDADTIRDADHVLLRAHAHYMMTHLGARLRLEGHADERGGTEYNIALAQRRAESVRRFMLLTGVPDLVMEAVSLGEEIPVDPAHNESAWMLNRRVELRYLSR